MYVAETCYYLEIKKLTTPFSGLQKKNACVFYSQSGQFIACSNNQFSFGLLLRYGMVEKKLKQVLQVWANR